MSKESKLSTSDRQTRMLSLFGGCVLRRSKPSVRIRGKSTTFPNGPLPPMNSESIDAGVNLESAQAAQKELQRQNERLQLLLNLTSRITSNLGLRELLREIST